MCKEDERLGRKRRTKSSMVNVPTGATTVILKAELSRVGIIFATGTTADRAIVAPEPVDPSTLAGIVIDDTLPAVVIDHKQFGDAVRGKWSAFTGVADVPLLITEVFLEEGDYKQ